jgi:A/G-specific adenine glycosylase
MTNNEQQRLQNSLLNWYDIHGRTLPWRVKNGLGDPYMVWLSEIMLQQTTVATVQPYFNEFIKRWPSLNALAGAELDDVLHAWQGLGYYARARNLHKCARIVVIKYKGQLPDNEEDLRRLPGIGPYTAAAIAAIAFGRLSAPVDGNIVRVVSRLMNLRTPLPALHHEVSSLFALHVSKDRPGDFVQAIMDLGATICMPRKLMCDQCPWGQFCVARKVGMAESLPVRAPKKKKPIRHGVVFWLENPGGKILLRRRPEKGLLGGMMEFPSTDWRNKVWDVDEAIKEAPVKAKWQLLSGMVFHTFTHFHLELTILSSHVGVRQKGLGVWSHPDFFSDHALPTLMKKIAKHVSLTPYLVIHRG